MLGLAYGHDSNGRQMPTAALSILLLFLSYPSVETPSHGARQLQTSVL